MFCVYCTLDRVRTLHSSDYFMRLQMVLLCNTVCILRSGCGLVVVIHVFIITRYFLSTRRRFLCFLHSTHWQACGPAVQLASAVFAAGRKLRADWLDGNQKRRRILKIDITFCFWSLNFLTMHKNSCCTVILVLSKIQRPKNKKKQLSVAHMLTVHQSLM